MLSFLRKSELRLNEDLCFPLPPAVNIGTGRSGSPEALEEGMSGDVDPYPESFDTREVALSLLRSGCSTVSDSGSRFAVVSTFAHQ